MKKNKSKVLLNVKGINRGLINSLFFFFIFINIISIIIISNDSKNFKILELFMYYISIIGGGTFYGTLPILLLTVLILVPSTLLLIKIKFATCLNLALIGILLSVTASYLLDKEFYVILLFGVVGYCWGWVFMKGYLKGSQS